jgi:murein DD-endopeptidase MepM/ murein hydrolase activator NlpD
LTKNIKIKINIISLIILFLIFSFYSVFAISWKTKWVILKQFKKLEYSLIFESDTLILDKSTKTIFDSSKKVKLYEWIRWNVQEKREFLEEKNIKINNKITNLKESVEVLDKDLINLKEEAYKITNQIIWLTKSIKNTNKTISLLKKKMSTNKDILYKYIIYLYKKGNYVFKDWEIDNFKTIFFSGEDIATVLNDIYFKWIIELTWTKLIEKHRKYVNEMYIKQIWLKKSESESKKLRKQLILKNAIIKQKKEFKEKLISISQWKQQIYEKFIQDKIEIEKQIKAKEFAARYQFRNAKKELLDKEWCDYIDFSKENNSNIKLSDKCSKLNSIIYIESQLKGFKTDWAWNKLEWPILPKRGISSFFHDEWYTKAFWEDHEALDIPTTHWTEIKAPADAYVIYVQKPVNTNYSYIALKHSNGIITVYWHLSKISVKLMDIVKRWEVFAKTWWTPWTKWAWIMTTWAHLHLEVWDWKKLTDPLNYLNLWYLNPKNLPSIYSSKYKKDYKDKNWKTFEGKFSQKRIWRTFKIVWDDEIERQKNFLKTYWVWKFKNWSLWVEEWINSSIDPTFLICVWVAETSLWKHLKTPYNIWNVWNTDSWATKDFASESDWIHAMAKTFNNKYLGWYNEIKLLSRYWNFDKTKPIYASSPDNWHNNIVSCMSYIKWKYVSDNYNFRLK